MAAMINKKKMGMLMVVAVICAMADATCDQQAQAVSDKCYTYVAKGTPQTTPSTECCDAIKASTIDCLCSKVTPLVELLVDTNKVIYVAEYCGLPVPHGQKCGSITVQTKALSGVTVP